MTTRVRRTRHAVQLPKNFTEESHQIFDRVTRLETQMSTLADTVSDLARAVTHTNSSIGEIKTLISGAGKADTKTILTIGAAIIGAMGAIFAVYLGPVERDVNWLRGELYEAKQVDRAILPVLEELRGKVALLEYRAGECHGTTR